MKIFFPCPNSPLTACCSFRKIPILYWSHKSSVLQMCACVRLMVFKGFRRKQRRATHGRFCRTRRKTRLSYLGPECLIILFQLANASQLDVAFCFPLQSPTHYTGCSSKHESVCSYHDVRWNSHAHSAFRCSVSVQTTTVHHNRTSLPFCCLLR